MPFRDCIGIFVTFCGHEGARLAVTPGNAVLLHNESQPPAYVNFYCEPPEGVLDAPAGPMDRTAGEVGWGLDIPFKPRLPYGSG